MRFLALFAMLLGLTACMPPPPRPTPLPYRFSIASFADTRPPDAMAETMPYTFSQAAFLSTLRKAMPYTLFGSEDASLNLTLTHFQTTVFDDSFALSMAMELASTDQYNRPMAVKPIMCSKVENRGFEMQDYVQQVWNDKNLTALTREARDQKMWDKLFDACVRDMASQFHQALVNQQTAQTAPTQGAPTRIR